jgi:hypothetical protein
LASAPAPASASASMASSAVDDTCGGITWRTILEKR